MNQRTTPRQIQSTPPPSEAQLVEILRAHFAGAGLTSVAEEVRSHGRARTDLILWDGQTLVGIEAKLRDWSRVIGQAVLNRLCYDQSYLAMWSAAIPDALVEEAKRFGLGILAVDSLGVTVLVSAPQQTPIPQLRDRVIESVGWGNQ